MTAVNYLGVGENFAGLAGAFYTRMLFLLSKAMVGTSLIKNIPHFIEMSIDMEKN